MQLTRENRPNAFTTLGAFNTLFDRFFDAPLSTRMASDGDFRPAVNIAEDDTALHFEVELPGFRKEDIQLDIEDGRLALRAERKWEQTESEGPNYHQVEHRYGTFSRTFALPRGVDGDNAEARYTDGVLRITLPKREPATRSKVQIQG